MSIKKNKKSLKNGYNVKQIVSKLKNKTKKENIDLKLLTSKQVEEELKSEIYKSRYVKVLRSTVYALIIVAAIAALIATLFMPVIQISGSSMTPHYNEGDIVITAKTSNLKKGDVIAFYHGNKILIKRVIAGAGSWVAMDEDGNVYVDGNKLTESYVNDKSIGEYDIEFPYQVPDGHWFVLSDQRMESLDSRNSEIGCVAQDEIIGKILYRVWPLKNIGMTR